VLAERALLRRVRTMLRKAVPTRDLVSSAPIIRDLNQVPTHPRAAAAVSRRGADEARLVLAERALLRRVRTMLNLTGARLDGGPQCSSSPLESSAKQSPPVTSSRPRPSFVT
jgi:hypothetical protein